MASDADFLMVSGDQVDSVQSGQVGYTDLSDSTGSDIDISTLIIHCDQNLSLVPHRFGKWVHDAGKGQALGSKPNLPVKGYNNR